MPKQDTEELVRAVRLDDLPDHHAALARCPCGGEWKVNAAPLIPETSIYRADQCRGCGRWRWVRRV